MSKRRAPKIALWLAALGSAVAIGSAFLPWYNVPHGITVGTRVLRGTPPGWETKYGLIALAAAGAALLLTLIATSGRMRMILGLLVIAAAGVAIVAAVFAIRDPRAGYIDWASKKGATAKASGNDIRHSLEALFQVNKLGEKTGIGTYGSIGGAGLAALAGLGLMIGKRRAGDGSGATTVSNESQDMSAPAPPDPVATDITDPQTPSVGAEVTQREEVTETVEATQKPRRPKPATTSRAPAKARSRRAAASKSVS